MNMFRLGPSNLNILYSYPSWYYLDKIVFFFWLLFFLLLFFTFFLFSFFFFLLFFFTWLNLKLEMLNYNKESFVS